MINNYLIVLFLFIGLIILANRYPKLNKFVNTKCFVILLCILFIVLLIDTNINKNQENFNSDSELGFSTIMQDNGVKISKSEQEPKKVTNDYDNLIKIANSDILAKLDEYSEVIGITIFNDNDEKKKKI